MYQGTLVGNRWSRASRQCAMIILHLASNFVLKIVKVMYLLIYGHDRRKKRINEKIRAFLHCSKNVIVKISPFLKFQFLLQFHDSSNWRWRVDDDEQILTSAKHLCQMLLRTTFITKELFKKQKTGNKVKLCYNDHGYSNKI